MGLRRRIIPSSSRATGASSASGAGKSTAPAERHLSAGRSMISRQSEERTETAKMPSATCSDSLVLVEFRWPRMALHRDAARYLGGRTRRPAPGLILGLRLRHRNQPFTLGLLARQFARPANGLGLFASL